MRISDWSSDVCSSDLWLEALVELLAAVALRERHPLPADVEVQRARVVAVPARRLPRAELRHQVVRDVGERGAGQQRTQVRRDPPRPRKRPPRAAVFGQPTTGRMAGGGHGCQYG